MKETVHNTGDSTEPGPGLGGTEWVRGCASLNRGLCKPGRPICTSSRDFPEYEGDSRPLPAFINQACRCWRSQTDH